MDAERLPIYCTGDCDACRDYARELGVPLIIPSPPSRTSGSCGAPQRGMNGLTGLTCILSPYHSGSHDYAPAVTETERLREVEAAARAVAFDDLRGDFQNGEDIVLRWDTNADDWRRLRAALAGTSDR